MDALLINPSQIQGIKGIYPNLGIGYIASVLQSKGVNIKIHDVSATGEISSELNKISPIVGISSNSFNFSNAKSIAQEIKKTNPHTKIVLGGPQATLFPIDILNNPEFDIVCIGEGENTFLELLDSLDKPDQVKGIAFREKNSIILNPRREIIKDLDSIPFPARNLMPMERYFSPMSNGLSYDILITSRRCPFRCTYCAPIGEKKFRKRSPENVADEIEELISEFGIRFIQFYDDSFSVNKKKVIALCDEINKRGLDFKWDARTRVDIVDTKLLEKMKGAGCVRIRYGVESGDPRILGLMNKDITLDQVREAVALTKQIGGMETLSYFMIGFPGESLESTMKTISLARELDTTHVRFNITTANPGTQLYNDALERGEFRGDPWRKYARGELKNTPNLIFETEEYNKNDLENLVRFAYSNCN